MAIPSEFPSLMEMVSDTPCLTPGEMERVIAFVQRWPDHFPPGALVALENSRPTSSLEPSAAGGSPGEAPTRGNVRPTHAYGPAGFRAEVPQRATEHATFYSSSLPFSSWPGCSIGALLGR